MSTTVGNVQVGYAVISAGAYVTAGGAGSLTDVGYTAEPTTLTPTFTDLEINAEQATAPIKVIPQATVYTLKVPIMESTAALARIAFRQPAGNISGTGSNLTLLVGRAIEQYHQLQVVVPGPGTTNVRTITIWKAQAGELGEVSFGKGTVQRYDVSFKCLEDSSVTTGDKIFKQVDA
jgi:hypothetical protein